MLACAQTQMFLKGRQIIIRNGKATFAHSTLNVWNDGCNFMRGSTYQFNRECLEQFYREIDHFCPLTSLQYEGENEPHTVYKQPKEALQGYMYYHMNNQMNQGHTFFHHTLINHSDIFVYDGTQDNVHVDVDNGERLYLCPRTLVLTMTGDGCAVGGTPINVHHMSFGFLKVCAFKEGLLHCRQSGINIFTSTLPEDNNRVKDLWSECSNNIGARGYIKVECPRLSCQIQIPYRTFNCADWKWIYQVSKQCVSPTAIFGIFNIVYWKDGEVVGVPSKYWYEAGMSDQLVPQYNVPSFQECLNGNFEGYTVAKPETLRHLGQITDEAVAAAREYDNTHGRAHLWDNPDYEHKQRLQYSLTESRSGILTGEGWLDIVDLFDPCHGFWAFVKFLTQMFIMLMWCVWLWSIPDITEIVAKFGNTSLSDDVAVFIKNNASRNPRIWFKCNTTGLMNKRLINAWPHVIHLAAHVAVLYEDDDVHSDRHTASLILVLYWRIISLMRFVWYVMFKTKFEKNANNDRPPLIQEMIDKCRVAIKLAHKLGSFLVCAKYLYAHLDCHLHAHLHYHLHYHLHVHL